LTILIPTPVPRPLKTTAIEKITIGKVGRAFKAKSFEDFSYFNSLTIQNPNQIRINGNKKSTICREPKP
jgi:hypothetical protein